MEATEKLPEDFKKKWIAALRSKEYKQGKDVLYNPADNSFCCLGVAGVVCEVPKEVMANKSYFCTSIEVSMAATSRIKPVNGYPEIIARDGVDMPRHTLAKMNDGIGFDEPKSFSEIADWIEENL